MSQIEAKPLIVVVGAGVVGLSTSICLLEAGYQVHIVAEYLPGDPKTIEYTSPWAGAHHVSVATGADLRMHEFDKETFEVMSRMIDRDPQVQQSLFYADQVEYREMPLDSHPFASEGTDQLTLLSRYHPNFKIVPPSSLPPGISYGVSFTAILIDTPYYLQFLLNRFTTLGGRIHRSTKLTSLADALSYLPHGSSDLAILINCSGLGALRLVGDEDVYPTRGQLVIVRAPWVKEGRTRLGDGVYSYTIPRPSSGTVVLGGSADKDDWDPKPREALSKQIKERCLALHPELLAVEKREGGSIADLEVVELAAGLRPTRKGGIRLEVDEKEIDHGGKSIKVIHEYGHGGYGFQSSWGSARATVDLVKQVLAR